MNGAGTASSTREDAAAGSASSFSLAGQWRVLVDFLDYYFPLTLPGCALFAVSFYLLGTSFGPPPNPFALWFALIGFVALIGLALWGRLHAFRLRHLHVNWDATKNLVGRLPKTRQNFNVDGGRAPLFFRLHYALRGSLAAGRAARLPVRVEGVAVERRDRPDTGDIEAPLWLPCCGDLHLGGRLVLRDVFGLTRHRIGPEEFRDLLVLPPIFPEKTPIKFHTMFSEEASRRRQISEEEKYYMREYIPGDRLKDINWKASQRVKELITRISPHALEESKLLHVEFRNFREGERDSVEALMHLNFLKSWMLSFMQSIKRDHPEFLFLVSAGQGSALLETEDDILRYARTLSPLGFVSQREAAEPDPDPNQEKFIFSTMYDVGLLARINSHPGVRYNIFRTVAGRGKGLKTLRFFRSELGSAGPASWVLRPDRAPRLREFSPAAGGGMYVEQKLRVKLY